MVAFTLEANTASARAWCNFAGAVSRLKSFLQMIGKKINFYCHANIIIFLLLSFLWPIECRKKIFCLINKQKVMFCIVKACSHKSASLPTLLCLYSSFCVGPIFPYLFIQPGESPTNTNVTLTPCWRGFTTLVWTHFNADAIPVTVDSCETVVVASGVDKGDDIDDASPKDTLMTGNSSPKSASTSLFSAVKATCRVATSSFEKKAKFLEQKNHRECYDIFIHLCTFEEVPGVTSAFSSSNHDDNLLNLPHTDTLLCATMSILDNISMAT